jgi:hypothetical protein
MDQQVPARLTAGLLGVRRGLGDYPTSRVSAIDALLGQSAEDGYDDDSRKSLAHLGLSD